MICNNNTILKKCSKRASITFGDFDYFKLIFTLTQEIDIIQIKLSMVKIREARL